MNNKKQKQIRNKQKERKKDRQTDRNRAGTLTSVIKKVNDDVFVAFKNVTNCGRHYRKLVLVAK